MEGKLSQEEVDILIRSLNNEPLVYRMSQQCHSVFVTFNSYKGADGKIPVAFHEMLKNHPYLTPAQAQKILDSMGKKEKSEEDQMNDDFLRSVDYILKGVTWMNQADEQEVGSYVKSCLDYGISSIQSNVPSLIDFAILLAKK